MLPTVTGEMRAVGDPELRFNQNGTAICKVRAVSSRRKEVTLGNWEDTAVAWVNVTAFGKLGENLAESVRDKQLFVVVGDLETREYESSNGAKKIDVGIVARFIGPSITFESSVLVSEQRGGQQQAPNQGADPWAASPSTDEPPF